MNKDQKIYAKEEGVNFRKPSAAPDGVEKMKVGQELVFVDGPWFRVTKDGQQGWVHSDYLTEKTPTQSSSASSDLPQFVKGQANRAIDTNTIKVRKIINDEFGLGKSGDPLNCTEYVEYQIKTKLGVAINWPVKNGRNGGRWGVIFQNAGLYKTLTEPKVNCAMSFTAGLSATDQKINETGHVAFVEDVLSDGSVKISEANWPHDGIYNERTILKDKWQNQYKAQFVDFS